MLTQLGQPVWRPGSPAGYDDIAASWAAPDALVRRVEVAQRFASQVGDRLDARALAPDLAGRLAQRADGHRGVARRKRVDRDRAVAGLARIPDGDECHALPPHSF